MSDLPVTQRQFTKAGLAAGAAFLILFGGLSQRSWAYTQKGGSKIPMGHEWITRMAAIELLGFAPAAVPDVPDPKDARKAWKQGMAKNTDIKSTKEIQAEVERIKKLTTSEKDYLSRYQAVYSAIIGERWVDLAGYNVLQEKFANAVNCFDAVAQEPAEHQYDHFLRRAEDKDAQGGVNAAKASQQRIKEYFVAAAMAAPGMLDVYDGGGASNAVDVDRNYFFFGRAVHVFQDSFSTEHTVRVPDDNFETLRQLKSYICTIGSEQHSHDQDAMMKTFTSGDVIWKEGTAGVTGVTAVSWGPYKASNMKDNALVATEATKDLWAAFIRTMALPMSQRKAAAEKEADAIIRNWLSFNETEMLGWYKDEKHKGGSYVLASTEKAGPSVKGVTQEACFGTLDKNPPVKSSEQLAQKVAAQQKQCLYNAIPWPGYSDELDSSMHIWFAWQFRNKLSYETPPVTFKITDNKADPTRLVRIRDAVTGKYMSAPGGLKDRADVYARSTKPEDALVFTQVGPNNDFELRVTNEPLLFLDYTTISGALILYDSSSVPFADPPNFAIEPVPGAKKGEVAIKNFHYKEYVWLNKESPYLDSSGSPAKPNSQWIVEEIK